MIQEVAAVCAQCGASAGVRAGRCEACGAVRDIDAHSRHALARRVFGTKKRDWLANAVAAIIVVLVAVSLISGWFLLLAVFLVIRPVRRGTARVIGFMLDADDS